MLLCLILSNVAIVAFYQLFYRRYVSDGDMFNNSYLVAVLTLTVGMFVFQSFFAASYVFYKGWMSLVNCLWKRRGVRGFSAMGRSSTTEELNAAQEVRRQQLRSREKKGWAWSSFSFRPSHVAPIRRSSSALTRQWGAVSMTCLWLIITLAYTYLLTGFQGREKRFSQAVDFCSKDQLFFNSKSDPPTYDGKFTGLKNGTTSMDWVYQHFTRVYPGYQNNFGNQIWTSHRQAAVCKTNLIRRNGSSPLDIAELLEEHNFRKGDYERDTEWWSNFWGLAREGNLQRGGVGIASTITPDGSGTISLLPTNWTYYDFMYGWKSNYVGRVPFGRQGMPVYVPSQVNSSDGSLWPSRSTKDNPTERIIAAQFFHFQAESNERVRIDFGYKPNTNLDCDYALTVWDGPSPPDLLKNEAKYCFYTHGVLGTKSDFNRSSETNDLTDCDPFAESVLLRTGRSGSDATRDTCPFLTAQRDHSAYTTPPALVPELPMNDTNGTWIINSTHDVPIPGTQWVLNGCKQYWTPACASGTCTDEFTECTTHAWKAAKVRV
jgi:hypothetical protein